MKICCIIGRFLLACTLLEFIREFFNKYSQQNRDRKLFPRMQIRWIFLETCVHIYKSQGLNSSPLFKRPGYGSGDINASQL